MDATDYPELRHRAFVVMGGESRSAKDRQEQFKMSPKLAEALGVEQTKTAYVVVEDGEIGVMTEHHSVVKSYVVDSLVEGEPVTLDVQTFEVGV